MSPGQKLRQLLAGPKAILMPGAANALTARIAEEAGFRVVLFTGAGFANLELGDPDLGLTTMTEVVQPLDSWQRHQLLIVSGVPANVVRRRDHSRIFWRLAK